MSWFFSISQHWSELISSLRSYSTDFKRVICILRVPFIFNMKIISKCESLKIITLIIFRGCRLTRFSKSVLTTTTSSEPCITFLLLRIGKTKICICILILYSTQISKVLLKLTPTLADVHYGDNWTEDILNLVQLELPLSIFFMFCYLWNQMFLEYNILL